MLEQNIAEAHARAKAALRATDAQIERGLEIHRDAFVCDCFAFVPGTYSRKEAEHISQVIAEGAEAAEVQEATEDAQVTSAVHDAEAQKGLRTALDAAGVDCLVSTVGVGPRMRRGLRHVARFAYLSDNLPGVLRKAVTPQGVRDAHARGERSIVWSANSTPCLGPFEDGYDMLRWMETYYYLGMRMMHLTYNRRNWLGDGCTEPTDAGLSAFGQEVVARMNDMGIIVDTPHSGKQTTLDAAKFSRAPVMASHTGAATVHSKPRCKSDEELKAIADTDGLIGVFILPSLLGPPGEADINTLLAHIDYIVKLVGPDHVCIGSDGRTSMEFPEDVEMPPRPRSRMKWWARWNPGDTSGDPNGEGSKGSLAWANWPYFTAGLVKLGYGEESIRKILGGNFLRVFEAVRNAAAERFRI